MRSLRGRAGGRFLRFLLVSAVVLLSGSGCRAPASSSIPPPERDWSRLRAEMVRKIQDAGVRDERVLAAMSTVPRHLFALDEFRGQAYDDSSLPIGDGQSTPQPYVVALMAELLEVGPQTRVLEIGTGSGYQAAVLASMGVEVFSIEIRPPLCRRAEQTLARLGYLSTHVRCGDGYDGWPEEAPFHGILVTAAPEEIPEPLLDQLAEGGKMVIPLGPFYQDLKVITRTADGLEEQSVIPVRFKGFVRSGSEDNRGGSP